MDRFRPKRAKPLSPARRRACIDLIRSEMKVSERRICRVLGQHRSTQGYQPRGREDEDRLVTDMIELARQYGSYQCPAGHCEAMSREGLPPCGCPAAGCRLAGQVRPAERRVERLWKREGLKLPSKQPKRGRRSQASPQ